MAEAAQLDNIEKALGCIKAAQVSEPSESSYKRNVSKPTTSSVTASAGKWRCPECDYSNSGSVCINCGEPRPVGALKARQVNEANKLPSSDSFDKSDWFCPKCDYKNKAVNKTCVSCGTVRSVSKNSEEPTKKRKLFGRN
ncbi:MAG: hypothetical protein NC395_12165 [Prevotella sp.]|nr:hypothetical protein [Prevotella sp.]